MSYTPAVRVFWDDFYEDGLGSSPYEWYAQSLADFRALLRPLVHQGDFVLHIGCGNSMLGTEILNEPDFPAVFLVDSDYSLPAVRSLRQRLLSIQAAPASTDLRASKSRKRTGPAKKILQLPDLGLLDACALPFPEETLDLIVDKGCLDAFLSNNQAEQGDNPKIFQLFAELGRVLRPDGRIAILSGNDAFVVTPYLLCGEFAWEFDVSEVKCRKKNASELSTYFFYSVRKAAESE